MDIAFACSIPSKCRCCTLTMCEVSMVRARARGVRQYRESFVSDDFVTEAGLEVVLEGHIGCEEG